MNVDDSNVEEPKLSTIRQDDKGRLNAEVRRGSDERKGRWPWKTMLIIATVLAALCVIAIPIGVCIGVDNRDCGEIDEYQVALEIKTFGPEIQISNSSSVYLGGGASSTIWVVRSSDSGVYYATFGSDGWFDKAIGVGYVHDKWMNLNVHFNNQMEIAHNMKFIIPLGDISEPICKPNSTSVQLGQVEK